MGPTGRALILRQPIWVFANHGQ